MDASVSVCMATFNGEAYIREQIDSILQSPAVAELIISDDGSSDATTGIIRTIGDPRIRLIAGPRAGLSRNFEHALAEAKGDYVFLSDQDDVWLPEKVARMSEALHTADLVVSDAIVVDAGLQEIEPSFFRVNRSGPGFWRNLYKCGYLGAAMALRREAVLHTMPFPAGIPMHDWWIGLCTELHGRVSFIDDKLILYRRHGSNQTIDVGRSTSPMMKRVIWRSGLIGGLIRHRPRLPQR